MLKAIVLDFDGVILESLDIKTRAFCRLFRDHPAQIDRIERIHLDLAGISRFEKFKIIYRDVLRQPLSESENERLGREFSAFVAREMATCPFVPGAREFLERQSRRWPIFIVSGTPEEELKEIVARRNLGSYCRGVYGSPRAKPALLREVLAGHAWRPGDAIFVGDAITDCRTADEVGVHFVGRVAEGERSPFPPTVRWVVPDLKRLGECWETIVAQIGGPSTRLQEVK